MIWINFGLRAYGQAREIGSFPKSLGSFTTITLFSSKIVGFRMSCDPMAIGQPQSRFEGF